MTETTAETEETCQSLNQRFHGLVGDDVSSDSGSNLKVERHKSCRPKICDVPVHFSVVTLLVKGHYIRVGTSERREFTSKSDYETCNITVLLIFLTTQTSNSIRPSCI